LITQYVLHNLNFFFHKKKEDKNTENDYLSNDPEPVVEPEVNEAENEIPAYVEESQVVSAELI
jgi:hypothetical protein